MLLEEPALSIASDRRLNACLDLQEVGLCGSPGPDLGEASRRSKRGANDVPCTLRIVHRLSWFRSACSLGLRVNGPSVDLEVSSRTLTARFLWGFRTWHCELDRLQLRRPYHHTGVNMRAKMLREMTGDSHQKKAAQVNRGRGCIAGIYNVLKEVPCSELPFLRTALKCRVLR